MHEIVEEEWLTNAEAIGDLARRLSQNFEVCEKREAWKHLSDREVAIHKLDALLTLAKFKAGRNDGTRWMGCPALPSQLLRYRDLSPGKVAASGDFIWFDPWTRTSINAKQAQ